MQKRFQTLLTTLGLIIIFAGEPTEGLSLSCPISRDTRKIVDRCPETEEGWIKAAAAMNCSKYARVCDDPEGLEYHCVIDPFVSELLEVCAYVTNILLGRCAEYNDGGNFIQGNSKTNCQAFTSNSCPAYYRSNQAFKYPGCYGLVKKLENETDSPISGLSLSPRTGYLVFVSLLSLIILP